MLQTGVEGGAKGGGRGVHPTTQTYMSLHDAHTNMLVGLRVGIVGKPATVPDVPVSHPALARCLQLHYAPLSSELRRSTVPSRIRSGMAKSRSPAPLDTVHIATRRP